MTGVSCVYPSSGTQMRTLFIGVGRLRIEDQVFAAVHRVGHLCDGECIFGGGRQTRYVEGIASRYGLRTLYACRFPCDLPLGGRIALPCRAGRRTVWALTSALRLALVLTDSRTCEPSGVCISLNETEGLPLFHEI